MTIQYNGIHSLTFYTADLSVSKNTWKDFHLIPIKRPFIGIAEPKVNIINIPGTSKRIDITDYITPRLTFSKIEGEWQFIIVHDLWNNWAEAYNEISDFIHGKTLYIVLDDDPLYSYSGILVISEYKVDKEYSTITFHYEVSKESSINIGAKYPVKFILSDGMAYMEDYGLQAGIPYIEDNNVLVLDYLILI